MAGSRLKGIAELLVERSRNLTPEFRKSAIRILMSRPQSTMELLDTIDGDPEAEDNADREATDGDGSDQAWVEWTSMRAAQKRGHNLLAGEEDDEDDDPNGGEIDEDVPAFTPRDLMLANALGSGPGCTIGDDGGGDEGV